MNCELQTELQTLPVPQEEASVPLALGFCQAQDL